MKVYKNFTFDAAHRILGHFGKCKNLHGHTYSVTVSLKGKPKEDGILVDFYYFKPFEAFVNNFLDHATLVAEDDTELLEAVKKLNSNYLVLKHSSCEYIAEYLYNKAQEYFEYVFSVEVKETPKTGAIYE
jgi:6-pyruvoyltetrahydropterin/6-carboxytetrahydropterin synthase